MSVYELLGVQGLVEAYETLLGNNPAVADGVGNAVGNGGEEVVGGDLAVVQDGVGKAVGNGGEEVVGGDLAVVQDGALIEGVEAVVNNVGEEEEVVENNGGVEEDDPAVQDQDGVIDGDMNGFSPGNLKLLLLLTVAVIAIELIKRS